MNRYKNIVCGVVLSLMMGVLTQSAWAGEVKDREENQAQRIDKGIQSGQLTQGEQNRVNKGEAKIEADRQAALADGKMTGKEKRKLNREENHESKKIHKLKHNKKNSVPAAPATQS